MSLHSWLSERGKRISFPHGGIVTQTAEARGKPINATIGIALDEEGVPLHLPSLMRLVNLPLEEVLPYASTHGIESLRNEWLRHMRLKNPSLPASVSTPVVTAGITHGLSACACLFTDPGDAVYIFSPYWGNYRQTFEKLWGATLHAIPLFHEGRMDVESLCTAIQHSSSTHKVLLLNFPNNPTGYTAVEYESLCASLSDEAERGSTLTVLCDDAYFGLTYDDALPQESLFARLANLHERVLAVKIDGATKEEYAWGLRVGFLTFGGKATTKEMYTDLEDRVAGFVRGDVSNCSQLSQHLVLRTLRSSTYAREKQRNKELLRKRFHRSQDILVQGRFARFCTLLPCNSGYFLCLQLHHLDAEAVRRHLLEQYDTGIVALGQDKVRIAFSSVPTEQLPLLYDNLHKTFCDLSS